MVKHNNVLPNQHFRKDWQIRVKTWFDQPGRKLRRRNNRVKKAAIQAPRPIDGLVRPAVRCQTLKYNTKLRKGRGFTITELKEAGIRKKEARTIGISVDHRRKNRSVEGLQLNVLRLKEYKDKLIVFPKKANRPKKGDSDANTLSTASQLTTPLLPIIQTNINAVTLASKLPAAPKVGAYVALRKARSDAKYVGVRELRKKAKEEEEKQKK